jgi:hypothetical protein
MNYVIIIIIIIIIIITTTTIAALQPFVGPWPLFQLPDPIHGRTPLTGDQPFKASTYIQNNTQ